MLNLYYKCIYTLLTVIGIGTLAIVMYPYHVQACPNMAPIPLCIGGGNPRNDFGNYHRCSCDRFGCYEPPVCYIDYGVTNCPPTTPPSPEPPPPPPPAPVPTPEPLCSEAAFCIGDNLYHRTNTCDEVFVAQCTYQCVSGACTVPSSNCTQAYFCLNEETLFYRDAQCTETFVSSCTHGCSAGNCNVSPPPVSQQLQLELEVNPALIQPGQSVQLTWTSEHADSCTLEGSNGDTFTGLSGAEISAPLTTVTTFTLVCERDSDSKDVSKTVRLVPIWQEF